MIHVLPDGFHSVRHYGLLASSVRKSNITETRSLLYVQRPEYPHVSWPYAEIIPLSLREPCRCCGGPLLEIEYLQLVSVATQAVSLRTKKQGCGTLLSERVG